MLEIINIKGDAIIELHDNASEDTVFVAGEGVGLDEVYSSPVLKKALNDSIEKSIIDTYFGYDRTGA